MGQDRLDSLMLMSVESDICRKFDIEVLINRLTMQLPEDGTCINHLIKNEFFVPFRKLLNCKSLFLIY